MYNYEKFLVILEYEIFFHYCENVHSCLQCLMIKYRIFRYSTLDLNFVYFHKCTSSDIFQIENTFIRK